MVTYVKLKLALPKAAVASSCLCVVVFNIPTGHPLSGHSAVDVVLAGCVNPNPVHSTRVEQIHNSNLKRVIISAHVPMMAYDNV